jgi:hypothetical protein
MGIQFNTKKKLHAFTDLISQLLLSDFPHSSSRDALQLLQRFFSAQSTRLDRAFLSADSDIISQTCITINERIRQYLPILGFLLRSTNVRNTFESYYVLLQIAKALLGADAKVIVSSEWDFSPLTYPMSVTALPGYVLLGMPSSESSNALILSLVGHELGHSVWQNEQFENSYTPDVERRVIQHLKDNWGAFQASSSQHVGIKPTDSEFSTNTTLINVRSAIVGLCLGQLEETFCDAIGICLFGASYAHAFHYLLAPSLGGTRPLEYPRLTVRAGNLSRYGGIDLTTLGFSEYAKEFQDKQPNLSDRDLFISVSADELCISMSATIYDQARNIVFAKADSFRWNENDENDIVLMFNNHVPATKPRSLADILNAGWKYAIANAATFDESERPLFEWTSELVLKSIEVLEYQTRIRNA